MATTVSHPSPTAQAQAIADLTGDEDAATLRWQQACVQAANTLTALPNGRYVNVRMERMRQGLELAQRGAVTFPEDGEDLSAVVRSGAPPAIRQPQFPMMMKWNPPSWKLLRSSVAPTVVKVFCDWITWTLRAWAMEAATTVGGVVKGVLKLMT